MIVDGHGEFLSEAALQGRPFVFNINSTRQKLLTTDSGLSAESLRRRGARAADNTCGRIECGPPGSGEELTAPATTPVRNSGGDDSD